MRQSLSLGALFTTALAIAAGSAQAQSFQIPGTSTQTRVQFEHGAWKSAVSRDGGTTWQELVRPNFRISTQYADFDPAEGEPVVTPQFLAPAGNTLHLVQFQTPAIQEYRDALQMAGAEIHSAMPYMAYLVRMDAATAQEVAGLEFVRYVGDYHPAYRVDPVIIADLVAGAPLGTARYNMLLVNYKTDAGALTAAISKVGGTVELVDSILVSATMTEAQLLSVANENTVMWIDRWSPAEYDMNNARAQSGAETLQNLPEPDTLDGRGLRSHVNEGVHRTHTEFARRLPYRTSQPIAVGSSSSSSHGTNTAGEVWAHGVNFNARGGAPKSQPYYTASGSNYTSLFSTLVNTHGVVATTQSWDAARTLNYTSSSATRDQAVFNSGIYATQSQSNAGAQPSRPGAWAKNTASIGGFNHRGNTNPGDDCWCRTGSCGPASDGRIGVTFTGYYDGIFTTNGSTGYTSGFGGTSGATPMVNGFSLLAIQMFSDGLFGYPAASTWEWENRVGTLPKFTTTKTLIMSSTRQLPYSGATNFGANRVRQGWGFPNVGDLYNARDNMLVIDEEKATIGYNPVTAPSKDVLAQGETRTYWVYVPAGATQFRAALTWADVPGNPSNQSRHRVNDLHLDVWNPSGTRYPGNSGLLTGPTSTPGSENNGKDTEEMVILLDPPGGAWTVSVKAAQVLADTHVESTATDADYSLTVRGTGGNRSQAGMLCDVSSTGSGDFTVSASNVPATGWTTGYTLMSVDDSRHMGLGNVFGVEADALTVAILGSTPSAGNVFAFTNSGNPGDFPNASYSFPAGIAAALSGTTFDATVVLVDASGSIVDVSSIDRQTIQ